MINTCIIGGGGFIGKYLVRHLQSSGRKITVIGRNPVSPFDNTVNYLVNDNSDPLFLDKTFKLANEVIELAYSTVPKTSFDNPVQDIFDNLTFSVKVFEKLLNTGISKVVCVSSGGTVYGHSMRLPVDEQHPTNPVSPYGITKLAIEKYGGMYHATNGLPVVFVRPGNAYGEGQLPFRGQGFIPTAIALLIKGEKVKIFGREGTIRDYVYVQDIVAGIEAALEYGKTGESYNIGTGIGISNMEIITRLLPMLEEAGYACDFEILPARPFDVKANILDAGKLTGISGWKPKMEFTKGLRQTFDWLLENKHLFANTVSEKA
jgi:UDP-glucose 4-epimerase